MSIVSRTAVPGRASRRSSSGLCGRPSESTRIWAAPERAAQVLVERRLDPGLADLVAAAVVGLLPQLLLQLGGRDLADVAEDLRAERLVRVVAQVRLLDLHARELRRVLLQVVDLVVVDGRLHRDRRQRIDAPVLDLACEADHRHVEHRGEALDHPVAARLLRHVADPELDRRARDVPDDHLALAVEDRAARRLDPDRAQLVVLGRVEVPLAREHLERPEPEEEHREDRERDDAEHADPDREARRQPVRRADARVGRQEARRGVAPLAVGGVRQGARPPAPARRARSPRRAGGRARRPGRRAGAFQISAAGSASEHGACRDGLAEQRVEAVAAELDEDGRRDGRDERSVHAPAARRLAVAAGPVAGEREQQRREAERPERGDVDDQPGGEPGDRTGDGAAQQRDRRRA